MEWPQNKAEKILPKVVLHFLRHSIKEKAPKGTDDKDIRLSDEGRKLAAEKYENPMNMRFSHVEGSMRIRTHETAAIAATRDSQINPKDLGVGKIRTNEALDVDTDEEKEYGKRFFKEYGAGRLMTFLIHESDAFAKGISDTSSSTYSRMAANIAGIIYGNFKTASRGASILERSANSENESHDFERILATHATTQECFLLKVAEKVRGVTARDELLSVIGENGFDVTEGLDVTLLKEDGQEQIRITYKKGNYSFDEIVPASVIEEIIEEGG